MLKGQQVSEEMVKKMQESKQKVLMKKFHWDLVEPYLDNVIDNGSRNRKIKYITLREFKQGIESGKSLLDIKRGGISKHLISFFSNLCQGKINLSKEKFIEEYESGKSLEKIAEENHINFGDITFLRELYDVKAKGAKFQYRKANETPLTQRQIEILYGSMMGDAKKSSLSSVYFLHSETQREYLLWKYREFENIASKASLMEIGNIDYRSERKNTTIRFYTFANSDVEKCVMNFYGKNGEQEKSINDEILNKLTPLSLAVWYMDDGEASWGHRQKIRGLNPSEGASLCTESFSEEDLSKIQKYFLDKWGIETGFKKRDLSDGPGYRIFITKDSLDKFIDIIRPYILPMFLYKIDYNKYIELREDKENDTILGESISCPLGADFSILEKPKQEHYVGLFVSFLQKKGIGFLIGDPRRWLEQAEVVFKANPDNLIKEDYISFSNIGNNFLKSFSPHFWEGRAKGGKSPKEVFDNTEYLSEIVRKILIQGYYPKEDKILRELNRYRGNKIISSFMPCIAKSIYHKYCDGENSKVLDFCGGYGGRLFGAMAENKVQSYTCLEVNPKSFHSLHDLYNFLRKNLNITKNCNIYNQDAINGMLQFSDKSFDFCFTSPPYFDVEEYSDDENQSSKKYNKYSEWFSDFLIKAVAGSLRVCKKIGINLANSGGYMIADDFRSWLTDSNIRFIEDKIRYPNFGMGFRYEPIFVFGKDLIC